MRARSRKSVGGWLALAAPLPLTLLLFAATTLADPPAARIGVPGGDWKFEKLELRGGRTYRGLVRSETETTVHFLHVELPPGAPLYAVGVRVPRDKVAKLTRLEDDQRKALERRLAGALHRARIEELDAATVPLSNGTWHRQSSWEYRGDDFSLTSTADEQTTRRAVVRLAQYFEAFSQMLPSDDDAAPLQLFIHGSTGEYRGHLAQWGLELDHSAVYVAEHRQIIAAADLSQFAAELAQTQAEHDRIREQYDAMLAALPERLREESKRLKEQGAHGSQLRELNLLARRKLEDEADRARRTADEYDRRNNELFEQVTAALFSTLGHEAFHAYLDAYLRQANGKPAELPRWLNEGLAQVFETAQRDAGQLRFDAPDPRRLQLLQADLAGGEPLALADLLAANQGLFLVAHQGREASERHYLYSWGLAYYLAVERGLIGPQWLRECSEQAGGDESPVTVFERLVGQPIAEFERDWRRAMLALENPTRVTPALQSPPG